MINYSEIILGFGHILDADRFGWSPHGLLKDSLGLYCKNYVSPIESQFSQDENLNKEHELVLLRDGEKQLKVLFSEDSEESPYKRVAIHQDFASLVPEAWASKTLLYSFKAQTGFFEKSEPRELILVIHSNQLVCNKTTLNLELDQILKARKGEIQNLDKVKVIFFNSRMVDEVNPISFAIETMDLLREKLGCLVELAQPNDILYGSSVSNSYFYIFNSKEVLSDPFLFHLLMSKGCASFLELDETHEDDIEIPLSIYHSLLLKNLDEDRKIKPTDYAQEKKKWKELIQLFTVD